jgi:hypothetical protein
MTARVTLAPLAAGDYVVELTGGGTEAGGGAGLENQRMLIAFRVVQ